jgi:hypothetical protein
LAKNIERELEDDFPVKGHDSSTSGLLIHGKNVLGLEDEQTWAA